MPRRKTSGRTGPGQRSQAPDHLAINRALWERQSAAYDRRTARALGGRHAMAWGLWRIPERQLRLLGPLRGRDVLELGCGAARWSSALAGRGAHGVGLDQSRAQLDRARSLRRGRVRAPPLVRGNAERLPFAARCFDIVFCDWGAMTFCDPDRTVPEGARVIRPGGIFAFAHASPLRDLAFDRRADRYGRRLLRPYFGLGRIDLPGEVDFQRTYGEWIRLFRANGFSVDRLVETRPPEGARSVYLSRSDERWGRSWPLEALWRLRKEP